MILYQLATEKDPIKILKELINLDSELHNYRKRNAAVYPRDKGHSTAIKKKVESSKGYQLN